jgi:CRISPR-associated protein Cmr5
VTQQFQTRDQRMAAEVYKLVLAHKFVEKSDESNQYGGMASKLPILIRTAGLAQALAYVEARGKGGQKALLEDLRTQLKWRTDIAPSAHVSSMPLPQYMRQTREALAALLWFKRYAQSLLDYEPGADDGTDPG